jgi:D-glycero-beta-D-manno-heptose 1-phosphate adenylyltransferase
MNRTAIIRSKIYQPDQLCKQLGTWRFHEKKIVFTNGCFDIIHPGHIDYLSKAADLGGKLIIGLNTDNSVKRLNKGKNRPLQDQDSRALILASLFFVDAVVMFDQDTPLELIKLLKPDILVKGADYTEDKVVGADFVRQNGGEVVLLEYLEGFSTTNIENKILESAI